MVSRVWVKSLIKLKCRWASGDFQITFRFIEHIYESESNLLVSTSSMTFQFSLFWSPAKLQGVSRNVCLGYLMFNFLTKHTPSPLHVLWNLFFICLCICKYGSMLLVTSERVTWRSFWKTFCYVVSWNWILDFTCIQIL